MAKSREYFTLVYYLGGSCMQHYISCSLGKSWK